MVLWAGGEVGHLKVLPHMLPILAGALSYFCQLYFDRHCCRALPGSVTG